MPTAKLISPLSYSFGGVTFKKGVEVDIAPVMADRLVDYPNFVINMTGHAQAAPPTLLQGHVDYGIDTSATQIAAADELTQLSGPEAILAAASFLSPDVETNFDADGRPSLVALSAVLGRTVTEEARDAALRPAKSTAAEDGTKTKVTIVRKAAKDATTEGAVTV
jgi:hypothetical protein